MKRPPNRKLALAATVLLVAMSTVLARSAAGPADPAKAETHTMKLIVLGGR